MKVKVYKILLNILLSIILLLLTFIIIALIFYINTQNKNYKETLHCNLKETFYDHNISYEQSCYCKLYELLVPKLLVYKIKYNHQNLHFFTLEPSYVLPVEIIKNSDVLIGYGIGVFNAFAEETYSFIYNKPSFAFDCGIASYNPDISLCHFESSCIDTDYFVINEFKTSSSGKIHKFNEKIKELNLTDKKVILKMDIGPSMYQILPSVLEKKDNINVLTLCFHLYQPNDIISALNLLQEIEKDFVLVARAEHARRQHSVVYKDKNIKYEFNRQIKFMHNKVGEILVLTFVNKNIADEIYLPWKQESVKTYDENSYGDFKSTSISTIVVLYQKLKNMKELFKKKKEH